MSVDPANAHEEVAIAGEIGTDVVFGVLRYLSDTGHHAVLIIQQLEPNYTVGSHLVRYC